VYFIGWHFQQGGKETPFIVEDSAQNLPVHIFANILVFFVIVMER
jgi:hypothetical protein